MSSAKSKLLIANWKANPGLKEAEQWLKTFSKQELRETREYVICPPQPLIGLIAAAQHKQFSLGAQDVSTFEAGAYTGESSAYALSSLGVEFAILGHSERRKYFKESNYDVAKKAELALSFEITPIICIDKNEFRAQIDELSKHALSHSIFAYEPVHAISTFGGHEDPLAITLEAIAELRSLVGDDAEILYGGSVDEENSLTYLQEDSIDGALVGKASLNPELFAQL
jgi:triosephosphate isomerase